MYARRKTLFTTVALLCLLFIHSCSTSRDEVVSSEQSVMPEGWQPPIEFDLDKILERGKIVAIVENNSTGYFIYKGQTMGYEYELISNFADYLGVEFEMVVSRSLEETYFMLNRGEGDVIAFPLTVTKRRKQLVLFSDYQYTVRQVLVQRKPDGWRNMKVHEVERSLLRNQVDLIGKNIHVRFRSSYLERLQNLSNEVGGDIVIIEETGDLETEDLIKAVADGRFNYTISDEDVALVNATYYDNIDVSTPISFPTQIAWAFRANAPQLREKANEWLKKIKREPTFNVIYGKYFRNTKGTQQRAQSDFFSFQGQQISAYDDLIQKYAKEIDWDWRLLAAQVFRESRFDPNAKSWAGAVGLMQLVPATGRAHGATNLLDPEQNIAAGTDYLRWLEDYWDDRLPNRSERLKFVLGSYNVGMGHVNDARALAEKFGDDPDTWDGNVSKYLALKSKPKYYNDPIVKLGYCRGEEPVEYVKTILGLYQTYLQFFPEQISEEAPQVSS